MTTVFSNLSRSSKAPSPTTQNAGSSNAPGVSSFSAVLGLKLGMGLNSIAVAQAPRDTAQSSPAASAPAEAANAANAADQSAPGTRATDETDTDDPHPSDSEAAADTEASRHTGEADPRADESAKAATTPELRDIRADAKPEAAHAKDADTAKQLTAQTGADNPAAAQNPAAAHASSHAATPQAAQPSVTAPPTESAEAAAVETVDAAAPTTIASTRSKPATRNRGASARANADAPAADAEAKPAADEPRDPLGLIRRQPDTKDAPKPDAADLVNARQASASQDRAPDPAALPETTRVRYADAPAADANHAAQQAGSTAQNNAQNQAATLFAPVTPNAASGKAAVGGTPATGSVGGVGAVGGASGASSGGGASGSGSGNAGNGAFSGLLQQRTLGVSFTSARGAGKSGASSEPSAAAEAQIARGLAAALRQKGGVMTLRLNPEHLGSMRIDITIEQGQVTALFDAQTDEARQLLRDNLDSLRRSIEDSGLSVQKIQVAQTTSLPPAPTDTRADNRTAQQQSSQSQSDQSGSRNDSGHGQQQPRRDRSAPAEIETTQDVGRIWSESDDSAQGLLRLRVDALI